jgi:hypothetical protein
VFKLCISREHNGAAFLLLQHCLLLLSQLLLITLSLSLSVRVCLAFKILYDHSKVKSTDRYDSHIIQLLCVHFYDEISFCVDCDMIETR